MTANRKAKTVNPAAEQTPYIIEGTFTVVATRELPASPRTFKNSPNRRRAVARIVFWNLAVGFAAVAIPHLMV